MKKIVNLFLVCLLAIGLAACSTASKSTDSKKQNTAEIPTKIDKPVTIEFWHAMTGGLEKTLQTMTQEFNDSQSNITVKLVNQGTYDDLNKKLMAAAKSHTSPVMAQAYEDWMQDYINNDLITDLTPYIQNKTVGWTDAELNDIVKVFREENTWNNKFYGVPFNKSTEILYYNTDMFKDNNLKAPTTWKELEKAAQTLTKGNVVGMGFENAIGLNFPTWVQQAGGQFVDSDKEKVTFDSAEGKKALTFLNDMVNNKKIARLAGEDNYMSDPFTRGDVGMYIGSSAGISFVGASAQGKINWATAPLPADKQASTQFQGTNLVTFDSAEDQQKLAAWEFMKFLSSKEQTIFWAKNTGYVPVRESALNDPEWKKHIEENPNYAAAEEQFDAGYYFPHLNGAFAMKSAYSTEIQAVLVGKKSVDQGIKDAAKNSQDALDKASK
ncbi:extracellular solute-binding protein [Neobacillus bataviensis LMG 21833]|uniref:Extracellular solute-binding protein n=1 Tax=Neobacillus bataviensis LMG 21833 TaxID=1117379 RepID=K6EC68_9BACI|nr:ABC transporter substrate-binding protein [Neobacillus bataviensis]EKN71006.1 extracellular solute-binding protein [Neobacillus bataviensis LMG 21833]